MSVTTTLDERLAGFIEQARDRRADVQAAWSRFDRARQRLASDDSDAAFTAAEEAQREYDTLAAELREIEDKRDKLHGMTPGSRHVGQHVERHGDLSEPGAWLANVIERHALGIDEIGTIASSEAFLDRLSIASAIMASGPSVLDVDTSETDLSRMSGKLAPAPPVPELDPIAESEVPLERVTVKPPKFARLAVASTEAYADTRPATQAAAERELVRSVAAGFDLAALHGAGGDGVPPGLENTPGIGSVDAAGALTDLSPIVRALGALRANGAIGNAIYLHPTTWTRLQLLKKATDSNEPLISAQLAATGTPSESILGVAAYPSEVVEPDKAFVVDAPTLVVIRRSEVEIAVDPYYKFANAGVGVRVIVRATLLPAQPLAVAMIENLPTT